MSTSYTVSGRLTYPDSVAALGVTVVAVDIDLGVDDPPPNPATASFR